jgi:hypothetical protein
MYKIINEKGLRVNSGEIHKRNFNRHFYKTEQNIYFILNQAYTAHLHIQQYTCMDMKKG